MQKPKNFFALSLFFPHKGIVPLGYCNHNAPCTGLKCVIADVKNFLEAYQIPVNESNNFDFSSYFNT
jgi:hypothetical protein